MSCLIEKLEPFRRAILVFFFLLVAALFIIAAYRLL